VPDVAITTDVIVGFPGETEEEFRASYRFCREMDFARVHVFPFSPRTGTAAAKMRPVAGEAEKQTRMKDMLALAKESENMFRRRFAGKTMPVLWEKRTDSDMWMGLTTNYIRACTRSEEDLSNRITAVPVT
jgi:threonylcarbamoyladenosine tRNA methylthiotransferase MtaB